MARIGNLSGRSDNQQPISVHVGFWKKTLISLIGSVCFAFTIQHFAGSLAEVLVDYYASTTLKTDQFIGAREQKSNILTSTINYCVQSALKDCIASEIERKAITLATRLVYELRTRSEAQQNASTGSLSSTARVMAEMKYHSMASRIVNEAEDCTELVRNSLPSWTRNANSSLLDQNNQNSTATIRTSLVRIPKSLDTGQDSLQFTKCDYVLSILRFFVLNDYSAQGNDQELVGYEMVLNHNSQLHDIFSNVKYALNLQPELLLAFYMGGNVKSSAERLQEKAYCNGLVGTEESDCRQVVRATIEHGGDIISAITNSHSSITPQARFARAVRDHYITEVRLFITIILSFFGLFTWGFAFEEILKYFSTSS